MAKKQQTTQDQLILIRKYKDVVGRIVTVFKRLKDPMKRKYEYTIESKLYDQNLNAISLISLSFPDRKACMNELKRYPRETREELK